jgi:hypothetical protein
MRAPLYFATIPTSFRPGSSLIILGPIYYIVTHTLQWSLPIHVYLAKQHDVKRWRQCYKVQTYLNELLGEKHSHAASIPTMQSYRKELSA